MKLYMSGNSPYARRVRIALRETGLADAVEEVAIKSFDDLLAIGPGGKIPVFITESGRALCESHIIVAHLNDLSGGGLLPTEPADLEQCRIVESVASVLMDSLFVRSFENNQRAEEVRSELVMEKERARCARCYDALEALVDSEGDHVTVATITVIAALGYADWRAAEDEWRAGRPLLEAYFERWMRHDSFAETAPKY